MAQIRETVEKQIKESHEQFKPQDRILSGLVEAYFDPPYYYYYYYAFAQREVKLALSYLKKGSTKKAEQVLSDLSVVLAPPTEGEWHLILVGPRDATAVVTGKRSLEKARSTPRRRSGRQRRKHHAKSS